MAYNVNDAIDAAEDLLRQAKSQLEDVRGSGNMFDGLNAIASGLSTEGLDPANAALVRGFQIMPKKAEAKREKREKEAEDEVAEAQAQYNKEMDAQRKRRADMFDRRMRLFAGDMSGFEDAILGNQPSISASIARGVATSKLPEEKSDPNDPLSGKIEF